MDEYSKEMVAYDDEGNFLDIVKLMSFDEAFTFISNNPSYSVDVGAPRNITSEGFLSKEMYDKLKDDFYYIAPDVKNELRVVYDYDNEWDKYANHCHSHINHYARKLRSYLESRGVPEGAFVYIMLESAGKKGTKTGYKVGNPNVVEVFVNDKSIGKLTRGIDADEKVLRLVNDVLDFVLRGVDSGHLEAGSYPSYIVLPQKENQYIYRRGATWYQNATALRFVRESISVIR